MGSKDIKKDLGEISLKSKKTSNALKMLLEERLKDTEISQAKKLSTEDIRKNEKMKVGGIRQDESKIQAYQSKKVARPDKKRQ